MQLRFRHSTFIPLHFHSSLHANMLPQNPVVAVVNIQLQQK